MKMYSPLLLTVAALSGAAVPAQDDRVAPPRVASPVGSPDYAFLDDVLGAKVAIQPGAEARREAAADNEKVKRPAGEIKDLILENKSGNIEGAVVSFGGVLGIGDKTVALPISLFTWNAADKQYQVTATEDQLKALPAFDVKEARKRGLDNEIVVLRTTWTKLAPATTEASVRREDVKHDEAVKHDEGAVARKDGDVTTKRAGDVKDQVPTAKGNVFAGTTYIIVPDVMWWPAKSMTRRSTRWARSSARSRSASSIAMRASSRSASYRTAASSASATPSTWFRTAA